MHDVGVGLVVSLALTAVVLVATAQMPYSNATARIEAARVSPGAAARLLRAWGTEYQGAFVASNQGANKEMRGLILPHLAAFCFGDDASRPIERRCRDQNNRSAAMTPMTTTLTPTPAHKASRRSITARAHGP